MNQQEFSKLKIGEKVITIFKGKPVKMEITNIYDNGSCAREIILKVPDSIKMVNDPDTILRHMYNVSNEKQPLADQLEEQFDGIQAQTRKHHIFATFTEVAQLLDTVDFSNLTDEEFDHLITTLSGPLNYLKVIKNIQQNLRVPCK